MSPTDPIRAVILADGDAPERPALDAAWPDWDAGVSLVVAADGGARHAARLGLAIDRWVGDGDSLPAAELDRLRSAGVRVDLVRADKDETDTELALLAAIEAGAEEIVILGATGGPRIDHALANVALLAHPALRGRRAGLLAAGSRIRLLSGSGDGGDGGVGTIDVSGRPGDLVSLVPFGGDAEGVRTDGLRYPLRGERLVFGTARGISNVRLSEHASVSVGSGSVLVVETPATFSG